MLLDVKINEPTGSRNIAIETAVLREVIDSMLVSPCVWNEKNRARGRPDQAAEPVECPVLDSISNTIACLAHNSLGFIGWLRLELSTLLHGWR